MRILVNNRAIEHFKFPGGEVQVKILPGEIHSKTEVFALLDSSDAILGLLLTIDAIRRVVPTTQIQLTLPYFPYARQDRVCNPGESLSVSVIAQLINSLQCEEVRLIDPHSDVTPALVENSRTTSLADLICGSELAQTIIENNWVLVSPDAGAEKKVRQLAQRLSAESSEREILCARKIRNTLTGAITATEVHGNIEGKDCIILDDICDGGQTFIELAKVLKARGARKVVLYVTHGIFSKGLEPLHGVLDQVYCYHTLNQSLESDPFLKQIHPVKE